MLFYSYTIYHSFHYLTILVLAETTSTFVKDWLSYKGFLLYWFSSRVIS